MSEKEGTDPREPGELAHTFLLRVLSHAVIDQGQYWDVCVALSRVGIKPALDFCNPETIL